MEELLGWCVVANVKAGHQHFSAGAKVWVLPVQWGDGGADVFVVGRHRGASHRGYIRMIIERRHLTGFRVRPIYSPGIVAIATAPWDRELRLWKSRDEATQAVEWWSAVPS